MTPVLAPYITELRAAGSRSVRKFPQLREFV
jgi:hypothetical protein